jgi:hypothetical protein
MKCMNIDFYIIEIIHIPAVLVTRLIPFRKFTIAHSDKSKI